MLLSSLQKSLKKIAKFLFWTGIFLIPESIEIHFLQIFKLFSVVNFTLGIKFTDWNIFFCILSMFFLALFCKISLHFDVKKGTKFSSSLHWPVNKPVVAGSLLWFELVNDCCALFIISFSHFFLLKFYNFSLLFLHIFLKVSLNCSFLSYKNLLI